MGTHGMVTSGHYLASRIGLHVLEEGGNAVDAGVADRVRPGRARAVHLRHRRRGADPHLPCGREAGRGAFRAGAGSSEGDHRVVPRGRGSTPSRATGCWPTAVPDAVSTWISALSRFGTMRLEQLLDPVIEIAERGFPMYDRLRAALERSAGQFREVVALLGEEPIFPAVAFPPWGKSTPSGTSRGCSRASRRRSGGNGGGGAGKRSRPRTTRSTKGKSPRRSSTSSGTTGSPTRPGNGTAGCSRRRIWRHYRTLVEEPVRVELQGVRRLQVRPLVPGAGLPAAAAHAGGI